MDAIFAYAANVLASSSKYGFATLNYKNPTTIPKSKAIIFFMNIKGTFSSPNDYTSTILSPGAKIMITGGNTGYISFDSGGTSVDSNAGYSAIATIMYFPV